MFDLVPDLPDDTLIETVRFSPLIRKSLNAAGLKTIGEIRAMADNELRRMRGIGTGSLAYLREALGVRVDFHVEARLRRVARRPWSQAGDSVQRS
jgi:DNA-directed RNA polymerase alpha subunit